LSLPDALSPTTAAPYDPDQLLAGYRTAWDQELTELLDGVHSGLCDLSDIISATQLSVPGEMQPPWGPDRRRMVP
jgi:hypothetical protein